MIHDSEFAEGYRDGRDPDAPAASANRSHAYRHSFEIGRTELSGQPIPAAQARAAAAVAQLRDETA